MDGAVPMTAFFLLSALANTLQISLTTPLPTPRIRSQAGSKCISALPTSHSAGAIFCPAQGMIYA